MIAADCAAPLTVGWSGRQLPSYLMMSPCAMECWGVGIAHSIFIPLDLCSAPSAICNSTQYRLASAPSHASSTPSTPHPIVHPGPPPTPLRVPHRSSFPFFSPSLSARARSLSRLLASRLSRRVERRTSVEPSVCRQRIQRKRLAQGRWPVCVSRWDVMVLGLKETELERSDSQKDALRDLPAHRPYAMSLLALIVPCL